MKKTGRILSALLTLALLALYVSPPVRQLNRTPDAVTGTAMLSSALLTVEGGAVAVRGTGDERLPGAAEQTYTVSLFGLIPLRQITVVGAATEVSVGGDAIGIAMSVRGVQVVGVGSVSTADGLKSPASAAGLRQGDTLLSVDGTEIKNAAHFATLTGDGTRELSITYLRDGQEATATVVPAVDPKDGAARIGAWVRDSTSGIGTLSVIDPRTGRYAALGHAVTDVDTGTVLTAGSGVISQAKITGVRRGAVGTPGELIGTFLTAGAMRWGSIDTNGDFGIAGDVYAGALLLRDTVPVARTGEVVQGAATLYATIDDTGVQAFSCTVIRLEVQASPMTQGMMIEVTDERLLAATGGIVQGMSGSPLMQNGKLIGVVTHVFVNDPTRGFCLYAEWMVEKLL